MKSHTYLGTVFLFYFQLLQITSTANGLSRNSTDILALLQFKESIVYDPYGIMSSWNDSVHFCDWLGITCSSRHYHRVTALNLVGHNLRGSISPFIGNLTFLKFINLMNNSFYGEIPPQVGHLRRLQHLNLTNNTLGGEIPVSLKNCSDLRMINLLGNKLTGGIPVELGSLAKLEALQVSINNLTGGIPASLGNVSTLKILSAGLNNLVGNIPDEIGRLKNLALFAAPVNKLSGTIPPSFYNLSSANFISLAYNNLNGTLPENFGLGLPNLRQLGIFGNRFYGTIPVTLSNASQLQILDFGSNGFVGQVPKSLGNLSELWWLNLSGNRLGSNSSHDLGFLEYLAKCRKLEKLALDTNNFGGILPDSIGNFSNQLGYLYLGFNHISGRIPTTLEKLVNLLALQLEENLLTGEIPENLAKLGKLQNLALFGNKLSGKIPSSLGNLTLLFFLALSRNKLEGSIPPSIGNNHNMQYLDISENNLSGEIPPQVFRLSFLSLTLNLSHNTFTGSIPVEVGNLKSINALDLSNNKLSGKIPTTIGGCSSLESLYLQGNSFNGYIPASLASVRGLVHLDLSRNNLSGQIPNELLNLPFLLYLNLSFNYLEGEVPNKGIFQNTSAVSVVGNTKICGGVSILQLPACPTKESEGKSRGLRLTIVIVCTAVLFLLCSAFLLFCCRWTSQRKSVSSLSTISFLSKVSYHMLYQATNGFSASMLIGTGSYGTVYKGILDDEEKEVAVKVLNLQQRGADKSFITECNALRNIRHRNLVKILTCCSSMDYHGNEFKALVFEYMSNGNLEKWLHQMTDGKNLSRSLNFIQRLNIVLGVASALSYLHNHCEQPIIHRDLKPSNVLLDNEMIPHVGDFGLARLITATTSLSKGQTSTSGIKGTIGYVAPEYAVGGEPSIEGDIYSYGILVLEVLTGRKPTDGMFKDSFNLHNFVRTALPERLVEIVDSALLRREEDETAAGSEENSYSRTGSIEVDLEGENINFEDPSQMSGNVRKCLVSALMIGLACSNESPKERVNMADVTKELEHIRNAYMTVGIHDRYREPSN